MIRVNWRYLFPSREQTLDPHHGLADGNRIFYAPLFGTLAWLAFVAWVLATLLV
jgi:hypothetical protein